MSRPIPGLNNRQQHTVALAGVWGGYIVGSDDTGYTVSIPDLIGSGAHGGCEAVPGTWVVGDAVWVQAIGGNRGRFLITHPRQR